MNAFEISGALAKARIVEIKLAQSSPYVINGWTHSKILQK